MLETSDPSSFLPFHGKPTAFVYAEDLNQFLLGVIHPVDVASDEEVRHAREEAALTEKLASLAWKDKREKKAKAAAREETAKLAALAAKDAREEAALAEKVAALAAKDAREKNAKVAAMNAALEEKHAREKAAKMAVDLPELVELESDDESEKDGKVAARTEVVVETVESDDESD